MLTKDNIAEAVRYADARSEELGTLDAYCEAEGVELSGLVYVANQRALRMAMILDGQHPNPPGAARVSAVELPPEVERLIPVFASAWLDGFNAGRTAKEDA